MKSKKIRNAARGQECQVRLPGICNGNPETTVFAHLNGGGGGMKSSDLHGCFACHQCHAWLDGGYTKTHRRDQRDFEHLIAMKNTQSLLLKMGLIKLA